MADEVTLTYNFKYVKGNINRTASENGIKSSVAAGTPRRGANIQTIGFAAHEALVMPADIGTPGWIIVTNHDTTNFVLIGLDDAATFREVVKVGPGETQIFKLAVAAPYAKADTAAVDLEYEVFSA